MQSGEATGQQLLRYLPSAIASSVQDANFGFVTVNLSSGDPEDHRINPEVTGVQINRRWRCPSAFRNLSASTALYRTELPELTFNLIATMCPLITPLNFRWLIPRNPTVLITFPGNSNLMHMLKGCGRLTNITACIASAYLIIILLIDYKPHHSVRSAGAGQLMVPRVETQLGEMPFSPYAMTMLLSFFSILSFSIINLRKPLNNLCVW